MNPKEKAIQHLIKYDINEYNFLDISFEAIDIALKEQAKEILGKIERMTIHFVHCKECRKEFYELKKKYCEEDER